MPQVLEKRLLTVDDFYRMADAGILTEDDRIELINGDLVKMTPIGRKHAGIVNFLNQFLANHNHNQFILTVQNPLHVDLFTELQPDLILLKPKSDFYTSAHPTPKDTILVIEVADTSLVKDQTIKTPLYAQMAIPEVWIVNVENKTLEVYREPKQDNYSSVSIFDQNHTVSPVSFPDIQLPVKDLFPYDS